MKIHVFLFVLIMGYSQITLAQDSSKTLAYKQFVGTYQPTLDSSITFRIKTENQQLVLEIPGQGQTDMEQVGKSTFVPKHVRPKATIEFVHGKEGAAMQLVWNQEVHSEWKKTPDSPDSTFPHSPNGSLAAYAGNFVMAGNAYQGLRVWVEGNQLFFQTKGKGQGIFPLSPIDTDKFIFESGKMRMRFTFLRGSEHEIEKLIFDRKGPFVCIMKENLSPIVLMGDRISNRENGFTQADTLRGMLGPMRSCYDVLFYDLDITVEPENKFIRGRSTIRFKVINDFQKMQVDLYANMTIEKIIFHGRPANYTRAFDAVFVELPSALSTGSQDEIDVFYSGSPQIPNQSIPMHGGILWYQNKEGKLWIESVCQGSGASLWWPCKDHLSDKPDSMKISVTVPRGLMDISNGTFMGKSELPGNLTRFDWYVHYPIANYNVAINIGDYYQFNDYYTRGGDSLAIHYYCMPYHVEKAKKLFAHTKQMLAWYEKTYGPYPFPKDGFTLMESLYPMEHQTAVSVGQFPDENYDSTEMLRGMWHEVAHEWWGNSLTCKDMADFWIHEAFATYSEYLLKELLYGKVFALAEINKQSPANKAPVIGVYNVNHIHYDIGDMYSKGSLILNTLRSVINDDSLWFDLLLGIQANFRYQSITTEDLIGFINRKTQTDYTYFFDQYLKSSQLPELAITLTQEKDYLELRFKWNSTVSHFSMPIKITTAKNRFEFIYPSHDWQTIRLANLNKSEFSVAKDDFLIRLTEQNPKTIQ